MVRPPVLRASCPPSLYVRGSGIHASAPHERPGPVGPQLLLRRPVHVQDPARRRVEGPGLSAEQNNAAKTRSVYLVRGAFVAASAPPPQTTTPPAATQHADETASVLSLRGAFVAASPPAARTLHERSPSSSWLGGD